MAVKLDVLINYLFDNTKLKRNIASLNKQMMDAWSPFTGQQNKGALGSFNLLMRERFANLNVSAKQFNSHLARVLRTIREINNQGGFKDYLRSMGVFGRTKLTRAEMTGMGISETGTQLTELQAIDAEAYEKGANQMMAITRAEFKKDLKKIIEDEKQYMANVKKMLRTDANIAKEEIAQQREKKAAEKRKKVVDRWLEKANREEIEEKSKAEAKLLEIEEQEVKERENKQNKFFNLLLGRWGKLGLAGIAIAKTINLATRAMRAIYNVSQGALGWQRTIEGGASGGEWFGQGVAAYQRAGISGGAYQGFKRGLKGYLGQVKLGMGNAAPLMYLGLSALDSVDTLERQLEQSLRRLPEDISQALAQQMGLSYEMWNAIYTGKLDREKSAYSDEAIKKWSAVADRLNDILTSLKVFGFNKSSGLVYNLTHPEKVFEQMSLADWMKFVVGMANPATTIPTLIKLGQIEVVLKDDKGNIVDVQNAQVKDTGMEYQGS